jgi:hypothetical protein
MAEKKKKKGSGGTFFWPALAAEEEARGCVWGTRAETRGRHESPSSIKIRTSADGILSEDQFINKRENIE